MRRRELHGESGAGRLTGGHAHLASHDFGQLGHDCQAQTRARLFHLGPVPIHVEAFEYMGMVSLADAGTIVVHRNGGPVVSAPVLGSRLYTDQGIGERPVHVVAAPSQVPVDQVRDIGVVLHQQDGGFVDSSHALHAPIGI